MKKEFFIEGKTISPSSKTFFVAEVSANHKQDLEIAKKTIYAASKAGADAIKLQTYLPTTMSLDIKKDPFIINDGTIWDGKSLFELYQEAYTPWEWHKPLFEYARSLGLVPFSSPFDKSAVDLLEDLETQIYKIASPEITDIPLIRYVARTGKPVIFSTGIANFEDLDLAVKTCTDEGNENVIILLCTTAYPAPYSEINLRSITTLSNRYNCLVGISDHTLGIGTAIGAVALGARLIEKHFIIDKRLPTLDSAFSSPPDEFSLMVTEVRHLEDALGEEGFPYTESKKRGRRFSRSIFAVKEIKKGDLLTEENVQVLRPNAGLHPKFFDLIIGKKATNDIPRGTPITLEMVK